MGILTTAQAKHQMYCIQFGFGLQHIRNDDTPIETLRYN